MRLICYPILETPPVLRPAPTKRDWMGQTPERFAYRCLPLTIANSHGWELLVDQPFAATWSGGASAEELRISFPDENRSLLPASHFGHGILTFQVGYLFETEEGHNVWIMGPVNEPKDGIAPLSGIIETDWIPYSFTMNWMFTRPGTVSFEKGESFCHFLPVPRRLLTAFDPEIRDLGEAPDKSRSYASWLAYKGQTRRPDEGWDKHYFKGQSPDGGVVAKDHETRLVVKPFADRTSRSAAPPAETGPAAPERGASLAGRVVRAHFMDGESQNPRVAFPDPLLSAAIKGQCGSDEVVHRVVAPFWRRLRQDPAMSLCYLWFLRNQGDECLEIHLHGAEDRGPDLRQWLEEALDAESDPGRPSPDGAPLWTGYCRGAALGGGRLLTDLRYVSLLTVCLARGCDFVLASLPPGEGGVTHGSRRITFLRALLAGLSALGLPMENRFAYLAYHRDSLLREVVAPGSGAAGLQRAVSALDARAEASSEAIRQLRGLIAGAWTGGADPRPEPAELGLWQRSLSDLHAYAGQSGGDPVHPRNRWAAEPAFVSLFTACHGIANQAGMTPVDEVFWCHLLGRAGSET